MPVVQRTTCEIHACVVSLDTLGTFFAGIRPRQQLQRLNQCARDPILRPCRSNDLTWGWMLTLQLPTLHELQNLNDLSIELEGIPSRLDVACNWSGDTLTKPHLIKHTSLKWRRAGEMLDIRDTSYWNRFQEGMRRSPRDLVCYDDKPDKLTGELNSTHLELKLFRTKVLKANGINNIQDVINLNPFDLFMKHIKWNEIEDFEEFVNRITKKTVQQELKSNRKRRFNKITNDFRCNIPARVRGTLIKLKADRAQIMRDLTPTRLRKSLSNPLQIPTALTFPK